MKNNELTITTLGKPELLKMTKTEIKSFTKTLMENLITNLPLNKGE